MSCSGPTSPSRIAFGCSEVPTSAGPKVLIPKRGSMCRLAPPNSSSVFRDAAVAQFVVQPNQLDVVALFDTPFRIN